MFELFAHRI